MKISAKLLLLGGNLALGVLLLGIQPHNAQSQKPPPPAKKGCCKHDTAGAGVCCADCCTVGSCTGSGECPKKT